MLKRDPEERDQERASEHYGETGDGLHRGGTTSTAPEKAKVVALSLAFGFMLESIITDFFDEGVRFRHGF